MKSIEQTLFLVPEGLRILLNYLKEQNRLDEVHILDQPSQITVLFDNKKLIYPKIKKLEEGMYQVGEQIGRMERVN